MPLTAGLPPRSRIHPFATIWKVSRGETHNLSVNSIFSAIYLARDTILSRAFAMPLTRLVFITGNQNKLAEVRAILGHVIEVDNREVDVPEIQGTVEEIAEQKARRAADVVINIYSPLFTCFLIVNLRRNRLMNPS